MNFRNFFPYLNTRSIILGLFLLTHIPYLFYPIHGGHRFRQAATAEIAMNFYEESPNLFLPRINVRGDKTGITGMEFPIYAYLVSLLYFLAGGVYDGIGNGVSMVFGIGVFLVAGRMFRDYADLSEEFLYPALFLVPVFYKFSTRFMPEMMGLFFVVTGTWLLLRDREQPSWARLCGLVCCLALGALIRPYFVFWGFSIIAVLAYEWLQHRRIRVRYLVAGISVLIPFFLWYFVYAPYLVNAYGIYYFFAGSPLSETLPTIFQAAYIRDLGYNYFKTLTGWLGAPFAIWGLIAMKKFWLGHEGPVRVSFMGIIVVTLVGLALVSGRHSFIHSYYLSPLIVPSTFLVALGFRELSARYRKVYLGVVIAMILITQTAYARLYRTEPDMQALEELRKVTNIRTRSDELFVTPDLGEMPLFLYVLRRRGWALIKNRLYNPDRIANLKSRGAKWVVSAENDGPRLHTIDQWLQQIGPERKDGTR